MQNTSGQLTIEITNTTNYGQTPPIPWVQATWLRQCDFPAIKGCPLGSATSVTAAVQDLILRTNRESTTNFAIEAVRIARIDGKEIPQGNANPVIAASIAYKAAEQAEESEG